MSAAGFTIVAFMLAMYVLLDGYDLGAAAMAPFIGRGDRERAAVMRSIGPFWNGNEVWLVSAGAALFALFPAAYAAAFSGFYLPLIAVLWMLMFRGIAMELRDHFASELWHQFWDAAFSLSSAILVLLFGVALGNLVRGVPLDTQAFFTGTLGFLLNPYALLVGVFALLALCLHGSAFAAMRIAGEPGSRALRCARALWWAVLIAGLGTTAATLALRGFGQPAWLIAVALLSLASLAGMHRWLRSGRAAAAFGASSGFLTCLLALAAGTLYPYLLPAFPAGRAGGVSIFSGSPSPAALATALVVTAGGSIAVLIYAPLLWRRMAGKIHVE